MGYTVGVPVFNRDGSLSKVVVSSRPLSTLKLLQGDFEQFLHNLEEIRKREPVSSVNENSSTLEARPMIGHSKALNGIWEKIRHVAASDATVLITGESGVGKEVVADEVYRHSLRNNRPYIKVNCAAIPASLLESELFGYDKGAFSGASAGGKAGLFELADGGTLLLDEIGDLPLDLQAKLLRAIQNREITRVGSTKVYGDNVFEKDGIRRDRTGDGEKTRCLCGKQGIFNRDGPAMGPQIIRQLERGASRRSASFFHALASPGRLRNGGGASGAY